jgi:hypothetical protein
MIVDIVKNWLKDNLKMTVKEARDFVRQKFLIVEPNNNNNILI